MPIELQFFRVQVQIWQPPSNCLPTPPRSTPAQARRPAL